MKLHRRNDVPPTLTGGSEGTRGASTLGRVGCPLVPPQAGAVLRPTTKAMPRLTNSLREDFPPENSPIDDLQTPSVYSEGGRNA
jgi:hypothetical protein